MRKVLVVDVGWLEYEGEFKKHDIELVHRPRPSHEGVDAMIVPATAWPVAPSRKSYVPIVVYGALAELRDLREEPIGYLLDSTTLEVEGVVAVLRTLWREGGQGTPGEAMRAEDAFDQAKLSPRERETARQMLAGKSREETARAMRVSEATVRAFRSSVFLKTGAKNAEDLRSKLSR